jgi:hypothetical protein
MRATIGSSRFMILCSTLGVALVVLAQSLETAPIHLETVNKETESKDIPVEISSAENPFQVPAVNVTSVKRPKLKTLIRGEEVIGDPQFLLDFAILGVAKCGTSTMKRWLCEHPEIQCPPREVNDLSRGRPAWLVERLYELPEGDYFKRGYKSPKEIAFEDASSQANAMKYLTQYWPKTKVMIGLRHPVLWFNSFYNFRLRQRYAGKYMPHPTKLIKTCHRHVCTERAKFHVALARLGKTDMTSPEELEIIRNNRDLFEEVPPPRLPNKIFFWITDQLTDTNETRAAKFRSDVREYVGFSNELPPVPHFIPHPDTGVPEEEINKTLIDICDTEYDEVRAVLMETSRSASIWISKYFLESEDVAVSSREHVEEILMTWMDDPCESAKD